MAKKYSFRFLWMGQSLANCGDVFYIVGLMTEVYALTKSAFYMSLVPFFTTFSRFISGLLAPLILDQIGLKGSLVRSQMGKTFLLLVLAVLLQTHFVAHFFPQLFLFVVLISFLDGWATPARNAMVPILIDREGLVKANGFLAIMDQSINMSGWALGGVLAAFLGGFSMIGITFLLFIASTALMMLIEEQPGMCFNHGKVKPGNKMDGMKAGWIAIWHIPALRIISVVEVIGSVASTVWMAAIVYIFVNHALHVNESWWGYINFTYFAGLIIGGFLTVSSATFIDKHLILTSLVGLLATSFLTLFFGWNSIPLSALLISLMVGLFEQLKTVSFETIIQKSTKSDVLAKVYSATDTLYAFSYGAATLVIGYMTDQIGVKFIFTLSAFLLFLSSLYAMSNRRNLAVDYEMRKKSNL
ncbi:MFS transporter [Sporolactobacillus shoreae]|uniref:MFS transporter n=1 Tax=Sporolactobacillus shoreae TaxID=1465501 RepID=A0A4Z0GMS2_9BACL|nr:MFS transporter [Sporolactobacillus shoreae]TGA97607.1 MFS transporter [Sporolactobacillus shoreae]